MQENYLAKWLNNELTDTELAEFKKSDEYASYIKIKEASSNLEAPAFNIDAAWNEHKNRRIVEESKTIQLKPYKRFLQLAAAVAVLLVASYFYLGTLDQSISTQYAENKEVILPDTSEVLLNAESSVSYSEKNWDKERNISLEGEAYFKVAKGKRFTVATDNGTVAVLGTQFNVENRNNFFEVTCFEGLVRVTYNNKETKLTAGTSFLVIDGKEIAVNGPENTAPSWINKESSFNSIPLSYVFNEFQRQHNVTVETKNIDTKQLFTGTFSNTNINLALQSISVPTQIQYTLEGNKVVFYAKNAE
ncbi:FecR family protein [Maribacter vaceletii]|uniref:FecR family protein n=1 Tax=Maribacter vaceletii TaxID=1206816 RepID=A0A495E9G8_9FLAO|nr:FecR family protein [Maribacter vaceletii]RKR12477.1 FecR family protein [Maribacter vaceletii]